MSFGAESSGGTYNHRHNYAIKFACQNGALIGDTSGISAYNYDNGSWAGSGALGAQTLGSNSALGGMQSKSVGTFQTIGATSKDSGVQPYTTVFFWRRTA